MSAPIPTSAPPATTFAAAVACIDGRVHAALTRYVIDRHGVDAVDLITEPGVDGALADGDDDLVGAVLVRLAPSRDAHASRVVVLAGHEDCAAMPGDLDDHRHAIVRAVQRLARAVGPQLTVEGVLVRLDGEVEQVVGGA